MHRAFRARLTTTEPAGSVGYVNNEVLPGDVVVGDIIVLPGADEGLLVRTLRLGQGAESVYQVTLTAQTRLQRLGRVHVL